VACFLKIIGPLTGRDFDNIRKIRNAAAHDMNPVTFDGSQEIASRVRELTMGESTKDLDLRGQFVAAVNFYSANLILRVADANAEIAETSAALSPYLDR
jgi:hypothetical protein